MLNCIAQNCRTEPQPDDDRVPMKTILGMDAGGSKTLAAIADEDGRILQRWTGPGFDPITEGQWAENLADAVGALSARGMPEAAVLGLPFHGEVPAISDSQRKAAKSALTCRHLVLNDVEVAYDGAFAGEAGVLVLAGTGSMAWAKAGGESFRVGGWGEAFGDEGSAYWIGREALSLASQGVDGRKDVVAFSKAILDACGINAQELIGWAYGQKNMRAAFAALAEAVSALAEAGNATAIDLLKAAAQCLADHAQAVRRQLHEPALAWSHAGSVFRSRTVADEVSRLLGAPQPPKLSPLGGALWRAAILAGWKIDARFIQSLGAPLETNQQEAK